MLKIKIHEAYRKVVAVCDSELLGKCFREGNLQLDVKKDFYDGKEIDEKAAINILHQADTDDATFNFVGKKAIQAGQKAGILSTSKKAIIKIQGIPHALGLL